MTFDLNHCWDCFSLVSTVLLIVALWLAWALPAILWVFRRFAVSRPWLKLALGPVQWIAVATAALLSLAWLRSPVI
jgi:hypothetical protein